jgi:uncharacterized repeat protein (TIGR01451 family)
VIRLSRARLAQFLTSLAVLIGALTFSSGAAQAASVNGAFSGIVVTSTSGTGPIYPWEQVKVTASWSVPDHAPAGTTFSLSWPAAQLKGLGGTMNLANPVDGKTVATCVLNAGSLDCTLTDYVTGHPFKIGGHVWFTLTQVNVTSNTTITVPFTAGTTTIGNIKYPTSGPKPFNGVSLYKDLYVDPSGVATWYVYLPGEKTGQATDRKNVVVEDSMSGGQTIVAGSIRLEHATSLTADGSWPQFAEVSKTAHPYTVEATASSFVFKTAQLAKGGWWRIAYEVNVAKGYVGQLTNTAKATLDSCTTITTKTTEVYAEYGGTGSGEFRAVSVGDTVWWDENHNGLQDEAPGHGIAGAVLTLTGPNGAVKDVNGNPVNPTTTDANGYYEFVNLPVLSAGQAYTVRATPPAGYEPTTPRVGADRAVDSSSGSETSVSLTSGGQSDMTLDFGFVKGAVSVGDYVWLDGNRDGLQSADEPGISGVTVKLLKDGVVVATTTTDPTGHYGFGDLGPSAEYTVQFVPPTGMTVTRKDAGGDTSTNATSDLTDSDAGPDGLVTFTTPANGVNSTVAPTADNPGIDLGLVTEINLVLAKAIVTTGPVRNGDDLTYTLTPHNDGPVGALAGWSVTDLLPGTMTLVSISGSGYTCSVTDPTKPVCTASAVLPPGAKGAVITVVTKVAVDDGNLKNVAYVSPAPGDVPETNPLVVPTLTTDTSASQTDNDAQATIAVASRVSVGDYVWWDVNRDGLQSDDEPAVPGVTVTLLDGQGNAVGTTVTDAKGYYFFAGLLSGARYQIVFTAPAGATFTTETVGGDKSIDSDASATGKVTFVAPLSGGNQTAPGKADLPTIDAGLVTLNLSITKQVTSRGPYYASGNVTYSLVPHNDGPVDALAGWSVTEVLPEGAILIGLSGDGYVCLTNLVCTSRDTLAAGADGMPITAIVQIPEGVTGPFKNVAYVTPSPREITETNPLVVPTISTDTASTPTDNDAEGVVTVSPPQEEGITITIPNTGATIPLTWFLGAIGLLAAGLILVSASRVGARSRKS